METPDETQGHLSVELAGDSETERAKRMDEVGLTYTLPTQQNSRKVWTQCGGNR